MKGTQTNCLMCNETFLKTNLMHKYCSRKCRCIDEKKRYGISIKTGDCLICSKKFKKNCSHQKYCSKSCKRKSEQVKKEISFSCKEETKNLTASRIGDISEIEMTAYYLRKGYEVFRNVSCNGPADLVVWNPEDNTIHLIDIKTYSHNPINIEKYIQNTEKNNNVKIVPYNLMEREVYREIE